MPGVQLYTTDWCGLCVRAKALLEARGVGYEEIRLGGRAFRERLVELGGQGTVPLVVIDGEPLGGYRELVELDRSGLLAAGLAA